MNISPLQDRLHEVLDKTSGIMVRSPSARELWHEMYPALTADRPGLWGKVTSRGEAQTLRLSMIYALLDGMTAIQVSHLEAAFAVWQYAEASARLIFPEDEEMDPLGTVLLEKITASPGINRKLLHKALGGHVQASAMVEALGKLSSLGQVRSQAVATGGRPSECWWPVLPPAAVSICGDTKEVGDANERTKPQPDSRSEQPAVGVAKRQFKVQMVEESLFDRPAQGNDPITLAELLNDVREMGGKIVRSNGGFIVQGVEGSLITPTIRAALLANQTDLDLLVPQATVASVSTPTENPDKTPRYSIGQYVQTTVVEPPLKVVDVTVYDPTAQYDSLSHDDHTWEPPADRRLNISTNYDRPRICVALSDIVGLAG